METSVSLQKVISENNLPNVKRFVRVRELSIIIGIPPYSIRKYVRDGIFPAYKIGQTYLFDLDEIEKIIKNSKVK